MASEKKTMTLNLTEIEMEALESLAKKKELTKTAVLRQALRIYQMIDARTSQGQRMVFEDDKLRMKAEVMVL